MATKKTRVYIVEDSAVFARAIVDLLSEVEGVEIVGTTGIPKRAIEEIKQLRPDVATIDMRISGGSGINVLKSLRSEKQTWPLAIMFSSNTEPAYRRRCLRLGANFVFDKSHEYNRVVEVLRALSQE